LPCLGVPPCPPRSAWCRESVPRLCPGESLKRRGPATTSHYDVAFTGQRVTKQLGRPEGSSASQRGGLCPGRTLCLHGQLSSLIRSGGFKDEPCPPARTANLVHPDNLIASRSRRMKSAETLELDEVAMARIVDQFDSKFWKGGFVQPHDPRAGRRH